MNVPVKLEKATDLKLPSHWPAVVCLAVVLAGNMAYFAMIKSRYYVIAFL